MRGPQGAQCEKRLGPAVQRNLGLVRAEAMRVHRRLCKADPVRERGLRAEVVQRRRRVSRRPLLRPGLPRERTAWLRLRIVSPGWRSMVKRTAPEIPLLNAASRRRILSKEITFLEMMNPTGPTRRREPRGA